MRNVRWLPDRPSPDDAAIAAVVRALEARLGSACGVPLPELRKHLRPPPSFAALCVPVEALTASSRR